MSNDASNLPEGSPRAWTVAGCAFAFMVGFSLAIPAIEGLSLMPTGYRLGAGQTDVEMSGDFEVAADPRSSIVEKNRSNPCFDCAASRQPVPPESSPFLVAPVRGAAPGDGVEV